jgi:hypothetical protein
MELEPTLYKKRLIAESDVEDEKFTERVYV